MKKRCLPLFLALFGLMLAACGNTVDSIEETQEEVVVTITLKEDGKEFDSKEIHITGEETLFNTMQDNYDIKDQNGFITAIEGKEQDEQKNKYWLFTINDEAVNKGAKDVKLQTDDQVVFDLSEMN